MIENCYRKLIKAAGLRLAASKLTVLTWGNISLLGDDGLIYITPAGVSYEEIGEADVSVIDFSGKLLSGKRQSSETPTHLAIYKARPDVKAILHTHPIYSTVFSCMGEDIPFVTDEAFQSLGDIVHTAPHQKAGTEDLAKGAAKFLGEKGKAVLLQSHGAVCVGKDLDEAFLVAEVLEQTAEILYRIRAVGGSFKKIP